MQEKINSQVAIFFDYDNQKVDPRIVLDYSENFGCVVKKRAYGDWARDSLYRADMATNYVELIDRPRFNLSDNKGNDIAIAVDAIEAAFLKHNIDVFVLVTGDADFIPLVLKLKEYGKTVNIIASKNNTSTMLARVCDRFVFYENLVKNEEPPPLDHGDYFMLIARKAYSIIKNRGIKPTKDNMLSIIKHFDPSFKLEKTGFATIDALVNSMASTWNEDESAYLSSTSSGATGRQNAQNTPRKSTKNHGYNVIDQQALNGTNNGHGNLKQANIVNFFIQIFENHDFAGKPVKIDELRKAFYKDFPNVKLEKYEIKDFKHAVSLICETGKFSEKNGIIFYSKRHLLERGLRKMGIYAQPQAIRSIIKNFIEVYSNFSDLSKRTLNYLAREVYEKNKQEFSKNIISNIFTALKFTGIFKGIDDSSYITYTQPMKIDCQAEELEKRLYLLYLKRAVKITPICENDFELLSEILSAKTLSKSDISELLSELIKLGEISKKQNTYFYREQTEI
ncbi:MAG: NYN domain-containing protein [Candidatus Wallbacteria bacterium]